MAKVPLLDVGSLGNPSSARQNINENKDRIQNAFDGFISRDGSAPNQMEADFDAGGYKLLNVADPTNDNDAVNFRSVRGLVDQFAADIVTTAVFGEIINDTYLATASQTVFVLSANPGNILNTEVTVDGLMRRPTLDYTLSGANLRTLTFLTPLTLAQKVQVRYARALPAGSQAASSVTYTVPSTGSAGTVKDYLDALNGPSGGAQVGFVAAVPGAVTTTELEKSRRRVELLDVIPTAFHANIAAGTSTDNVLAYINALTSIPNLQIDLPQGVIAVNGTINITGTDTILVGKNSRGSVIKQLSNTATTINATGEHSGGQGLLIQYAGIASAGYGILSVGQYCRWNDVEIRGAWNGLHFLTGVGQRASGLVLGNIRNYGLGVESTNDVFVNQAIVACEPGTPGAPLFLKNFVEAFCLTDADLLFGLNSVVTQVDVFSHGNRLQPAFCRFTNVFFDTSDQGSLLDKMYECDFTGCWFSAGRTGIGYSGVTITNCQHIRFTGGVAQTNGRHGVYLRNTSQKISFTNFSAHGNGITALTGSDGIFIEAGTQQFSIVGGFHQNDNANSHQEHGITVSAGSSDNYTIVGTNVLGNSISGLVDGGTGTSKKVTGNIGHTPAANTPTLQGTWANFGAGYAPAGYIKDADGYVQLSGTVASGTVPSAIFTLPAGYRPSAQMTFSIFTNTGAGRLDVKANGSVELTSGGNGAVALDGVRFQVT